MRPKLIKLLIVSRFSKPLIALLIFVIAYSALMSVFVSPEALQVGYFWTYYIVGITAFFITLMTMMGGVAIMKSDLDYLFTMPLSRRELAVSLYITQFLATGISYVILFGYVFAFIGGDTGTKLIIAADMILIGLLQTSLSIVSFKLNTKGRIALGGAMGVYALIPLAGLNYSFTSVFTGNVMVGTLVIVILNVIFNYIALTQLSTIEIGFTKVSALRSSAEYKKTERFVGLSRRAAVIRRYLSEISFTGRFNLGGSVSVRVSRVRLRVLLIPVAVLAGIYTYLALLFETHDGSPGVAIVLASLYLGIFIPMFFPEVFSHERAWLAFSSMSAKTYWKYVIYAKVIQTYVVLLPFIIADIFLAVRGVGGALNGAIFVAGVIPSSPLLSMYFSGKFQPVQVIDMETLPMEFSLRQFATMFPVILFAIAAIISLFSVVLALICVAFFVAVSIGIYLNNRMWNRTLYRLTEKGYV